jgi:hypothetical protein
MITASFKITPEQMGLLRGYAHEKRMTISDYLRATVFPPKKTRPPKVILKKHPLSGCWYNAAPGQASPTREKLAELLADFP